jgi:hypothetical protein
MKTGCVFCQKAADGSVVRGTSCDASTAVIVDDAASDVWADAMGREKANMKTGQARRSSDRMSTIISSSKEVPGNERRCDGQSKGKWMLKRNIRSTSSEQGNKRRYPNDQPGEGCDSRQNS